MHKQFKTNKEIHREKLDQVLKYDAIENMKVRPSAKRQFEHKAYDHLEEVRNAMGNKE